MDHLGTVVARVHAAGVMRGDISARDLVTAVCGMGKIMRPVADDDAARPVAAFCKAVHGPLASKERLSAVGGAARRRARKLFSPRHRSCLCLRGLVGRHHLLTGDGIADTCNDVTVRSRQTGCKATSG